jgi:hypothetical protein
MKLLQSDLNLRKVLSYLGWKGVPQYRTTGAKTIFQCVVEIKLMCLRCLQSGVSQ